MSYAIYVITVKNDGRDSRTKFTHVVVAKDEQEAVRVMENSPASGIRLHVGERVKIFSIPLPTEGPSRYVETGRERQLMPL